MELIPNSLSNCFLKSKLFTIIFFGYLKKILKINLLIILEDHPPGAVLDLVIMLILKKNAKKIA